VSAFFPFLAAFIYGFSLWSDRWRVMHQSRWWDTLWTGTDKTRFAGSRCNRMALDGFACRASMWKCSPRASYGNDTAQSPPAV
jgi:hypothetical protein